MNEEQFNELKRLIRKYGSAREELGTVPSSLYWNTANNKVEDAENELFAYMATLKQ